MSDASLFDMQAMEQPGASQASPVATHSLYRKYRPTTFADDDLVGQEHVVNTLRNAIALNRISHAYLFCGPRGTGKTTTARLLAKAVNCLDPEPHARPCNDCAACAAINSNATTDVIEIDAASNRGIDDIRDLRERVKYAPTQLNTKFYIIDEAHQITGAAANAFLKTLEEPPPHTKFVLATTDPEELLQTIVSRCQRFDFRRINLDAMVSRLKTVAAREHIEIDDDALPVIARQATGSLRDALGMLDQVAVYRESDASDIGPVTADMVRSVLGVSRNERVETLARSIADHDAGAGLREISAAVDAGDDMRQLGRQLVSYIRLLLLQKAGGSPDADDTARELAERFTMAELAALIRQLADIDFRAKRATLPQLPLEIAIVESASRDRGPSQASAAAEPSASYSSARSNGQGTGPGRFEPSDLPPVDNAPRPSLKDRVRGAPAPPAPRNQRPRPTPESGREPVQDNPLPEAMPVRPAPTIASAAGTSAGLERLIDLWPKIRADVKALNRRIEALLQQVDPAGMNGSQVVLASPYEFHRNRVNTDEVRHVVEDVIGRLVGAQVQVTCVTREEADRIVGNRQGGMASTTQEETAPVERMAAPAAKGPVDPASRPAPGEQHLTDVVDAEGPSDKARKEEEQRIQAAKNIFDAEEVRD